MEIIDPNQESFHNLNENGRGGTKYIHGQEWPQRQRVEEGVL